MITITPSGISVDPALVAGEPVAVSVSGFTLAEGAALTLVASACKANYAIATAVLAAGEGGTWTGLLDTATTAASLFFAGASACESRGIRLELLDTAHRDSLAALCCPLVNSALIPPLNPSAVAPVYLPVPGEAATVEVGAVETLPAGSDATVENTGSASAAVLVFGIPRGAPGQKGDQGPVGGISQHVVNTDLIPADNVNATWAPGMTFTYQLSLYPNLSSLYKNSPRFPEPAIGLGCVRVINDTQSDRTFEGTAIPPGGAMNFLGIRLSQAGGLSELCRFLQTP